MAKSKTKPAFPGRSNAMGYEPGLSKLEWVVTQLVVAEIGESVTLDLDIVINTAKQIIKACEAAEASDT